MVEREWAMRYTVETNTSGQARQAAQVIAQGRSCEPQVRVKGGVTGTPKRRIGNAGQKG